MLTCASQPRFISSATGNNGEGMKSFWEKLPRPFFALAPLADVTDPAFRALVAKYGKPDVIWTEFISADGLYHLLEKVRERPRDAAARRVKPSAGEAVTLSARRLPRKLTFSENPLMRDLQFTKAERPIVMQAFSGKPKMIAYAARLAEELGFDGLDINMGCPDKAIEKQGAGAGLMRNPKLALELVVAAKAATTLPISVKTRVGYHYEILDEWVPLLLSTKPAALTIHLRTRREMSAAPADWGLMKRAVALRDKCGSNTLLIGNGDVKDLGDARAKAKESGADGVMMGRAIFGNPWLFTGRTNISTKEKLEVLVELAYAFEKLSPPKSFVILKKHIKAFVMGFEGAVELRAKMMKAENAKELAESILGSNG